MNSKELRKKFLDYFKTNNHEILASAPLVTPDEKGVTNSTLFNTAGVQPLIPYLLGKEHPKGKRLASAQKCIRTVDIDSVGDKTHLTFFEMLGNWSLGDYFKEDAIKMSYDFLTNSEIGLGLDPERIYVTVFKGNEVAPKDEEAIAIWKKYVPEKRVYELEDNWWEAGENGPCGPDTEIFYDLTEKGLGDLDLASFKQQDEAQNLVEIWNNVFMQFEKKNNEIVGELPYKAVDTGAGLERLLITENKAESIYQTDLFADIVKAIKETAPNFRDNSAFIVADHIKASAMIISEGVKPSNTDRGYILRRLLRRAIRHADLMGLPENFLTELVPIASEIYDSIYEININLVQEVISDEEQKFRKTLKKGLDELQKNLRNSANISGDLAFKLFTTYGFPIELTCEVALEMGVSVDMKSFEEEMTKHKELSKTASAAMFKGGLSGHGEAEVRYHTATHLLHQALRLVLGEHVEQRGSNITAERLRFDFTHPNKMTEEEKAKVEEIVNQKISENLPVNQVVLPKEKALETGALHLFDQKYEDEVSIYFVGSDLDTAFSKEFCGGPHVSHTGELGKFVIKKEEASSAGVRRIKAILEK